MRKVVLPIKPDASEGSAANNTTTPTEDQDEDTYPRCQNNLPLEILQIIKPALAVGAFTGATGVFVGAFAGVARSTTPKLFAVASGIQWFTLGTAFWGSRGAILHEWGSEGTSKMMNTVSTSAMAGAIAGFTGGLFRGPGNIIPGAIMFSLFGSAGQAIYNRTNARKSAQPDAEEKPRGFQWMNSKWNPMQVLTDMEYENMLQEKLLGINARIALIDESIEALRAEEKDLAEKRERKTKALD
ncbi:hypothetical protein BJ878DRAFT_525434 [Calycina marina]|uniref:Uncharacterized protein n=1 Tax=Calycina marina TaxID=1763456 RepID=A0A9P7YWA1_9HELO|nr:hypothetical protein BJ878DRAFT_525434 [Calycina marina]